MLALVIVPKVWRTGVLRAGDGIRISRDSVFENRYYGFTPGNGGIRINFSRGLSRDDQMSLSEQLADQTSEARHCLHRATM